MRYMKLMIAVLLLLGGGVVQLAAAEKPDGRPSIIVFLADDVDWKDYGSYGNDAIRTPNIDRLATDGLRFTHAFLTTSSCSPTRISVLTGKYPHATGAEDLHMKLPEGQKFVSSYLREAGYFTGHMQKTHYGPNGMKQFDWYSKDLDMAGFLEASGTKPFFLWVGFYDAHRPYKAGALDPPHDPAKVKVPPYLVDSPETRIDLAMYYDEIGRMDQNIGRMLAELERRGRADNTLVVFFGDNGMPFPRAKGTVYDSGIGTPLVMRWPKAINPGTEHTDLASVIDLAPTFMDIAGLDIPPDMQGRSIRNILEKPDSPGREMIFSERNWHNCDEHIRTVRSKRFKLIENAYLDLPLGMPSDCTSCPSWHSLQTLKAAGKLTEEQSLVFRSPRPRLELYDLENDPWEFNNLIDSAGHKEIIERLAGSLTEWRKTTGDFPSTKRRRADNCDRITGVKFTRKIAPQTDTE